MRGFGGRRGGYRDGEDILAVCSRLASLSTATSPKHDRRTISWGQMLSGFRSVDPTSTARAWQSSSMVKGRSAWDIHISTSIPTRDRSPFCALIRWSVCVYTLSRSTPVVATFCNIFFLLASEISPNIASIFNATSINLYTVSISDPGPSRELLLLTCPRPSPALFSKSYFSNYQASSPSLRYPHHLPSSDLHK